MILIKLQEALAEVDSQRASIDEVEKQLRSMIAKLSGVPEIILPNAARTPCGNLLAAGHERVGDRLDDIAEILRAEGKPLHITKIAERLSAIKGAKIQRTAIEPGLNRHVGTVKKRRIDKFGRSTFGLPEWKHSPLTKTA